MCSAGVGHCPGKQQRNAWIRMGGAAALCGTAMGAALQSLNERNERWFKIWRNLRGRNSTEDG